MMNIILILVAIFSLECFGISLNESHSLANAKVGEDVVGSIQLSSELSMNFKIETTTKGNGFFKIKNINERVLDFHNDGDLFHSGWLTIDVKDLDGDGIKEIVLSGIYQKVDDDDNPLESRVYIKIFRYNSKVEKFVIIYELT